MLLPKSIFLLTCIIAAIRVHTAAPTSPNNATNQNFPGWPIALDGIPLTPLPLSETDQRFAANFPGQTATFQCGPDRVLLRWLDRPTRQLHPPSDCLRALGYSIESKPVTVDPDGRQWGTIEATKDSTSLTVETRIHDSVGNSYSDISTWFWSAALTETHAPWWSITIFRDISDSQKSSSSSYLSLVLDPQQT